MTRAGLLKRAGLVCFVLLAALNWVAYFDIQLPSDTTKMLDLRPLGYDFEDASAFAYALQFASQDAYNKVYLPLDYLFIGSLFAVLWLISVGFRKQRFWWVIVVFASAFVAADVSENLMVSQIINDFQGEDTGLVARASFATVTKFSCLLGAVICSVVFWRKGAKT